MSRSAASRAAPDETAARISATILARAMARELRARRYFASRRSCFSLGLTPRTISCGARPATSEQRPIGVNTAFIASPSARDEHRLV
ncbi:hypothetical protein [Methylocystis parvus]|uniref:hypothetical protein n=1 Tax=Methylocystis parvus TaxID=134 RepID=UPI003C75A84D